MKKVTVLFGFGVAGVVFCFAMTVYTGISRSVGERRSKQALSSVVIPSPAVVR